MTPTRQKAFYFILVSCGMLYTAAVSVTIIPVPKEMTDPSQNWTIATSDNCAIVIGASASEPESYAAEQFQKWMQKRFGRTFEIKRENEVLTSYVYIFLLGTRANNAWLDELATSNSVNLSASSPGYNGYIIQMVSSAGKSIVLVGGSDASGVIYGQNTLFQLCEMVGNDSIRLNHTVIRDWPSVRQRGSHYSPVNRTLAPDMLDRYIMGRFNIADMRNGCYGGNEGSINDTQAVRLVTECHNRGFYVWGSMSAIVASTAEINTKIQYCDKYLHHYGVDGVWANVDDAGEGTFTEAMIDTFVKWGRANGLSDSDLMLLPPQHPIGYGSVIGSWNQGIQSAIPATKDIQWIYTQVPSPANTSASNSLGLALKPFWWINSPGSEVGLSFYPQYGNISSPNSQMAPSNVFYRELQDFKNTGWTYNTDFEAEPMRSLGDLIEGATLWRYSLFQEEYVFMNLGAILWNPGAYVFADVRKHIYETVFGKERAPYAAEFDSCLVLLKSGYFNLYIDCPRPPALKGDSLEAVDLAQHMCQCAANIKNNPYTMIDSARYNERYAQGMEKVVKIAYGYLGLSYLACEPTTEPEKALAAARPMQVLVFPNPFNPATTIAYDAGMKGQRTVIDIYDIGGRLVWSHVPRNRQGVVAWRGEDIQGKAAASGIYMLVFRSSTETHRKTLVLMK